MEISVSILVLVDDGRRPSMPTATGGKPPTVSILVLVDDGRRPPRRSRMGRRPAGFYPCSCGGRSSTAVLSSRRTRCFRGFQSLFLWMTVVDIQRHRQHRNHIQVSILVLVDDGRRRITLCSGPSRTSMFQSLFLWMTVVDLAADGGTMGRKLRCFNPCSCGFCLSWCVDH